MKLIMAMYIYIERERELYRYIVMIVADYVPALMMCWSYYDGLNVGFGRDGLFHPIPLFAINF